MNIALTGGGTAGHIMPNLALLTHLSKNFDNIIYIGNKSGQERTLCDKHNVPFEHCDSIKFDRKHKLRNFKIPFVLPSYISQAKKILLKHKIDIVFSKGGFVALPIALAARQLKIPVVCHESDFSLGLCNKIVSKFAKKTILSYPMSNMPSNFVCIGNPLREEIFNASPQSVFHNHDISSNKKILLIVGGSVGAKVINDCIYDSLDLLTQEYTVIHICGNSMSPIKHKDYHQLQFVHNIADYLQVADLIVARCGASLSGEITALNKKVLYIPLSSNASRGDQVQNSRYLCEKNLAIELAQEDLSPSTLVYKLKYLDKEFIKKHYFYDRSIPKKIVDEIVGCVKKI